MLWVQLYSLHINACTVDSCYLRGAGFGTWRRLDHRYWLDDSYFDPQGSCWAKSGHFPLKGLAKSEQTDCNNYCCVLSSNSDRGNFGNFARQRSHNCGRRIHKYSRRFFPLHCLLWSDCWRIFSARMEMDKIRGLCGGRHNNLVTLVPGLMKSIFRN